MIIVITDTVTSISSSVKARLKLARNDRLVDAIIIYCVEYFGVLNFSGSKKKNGELGCSGNCPV